MSSIALKYFNRENYRKALELFLEELENSQSREEVAYNANLAALCLYFLHMPDESLRYFEIALENTEGTERDKVIGNIEEVKRFVERIKRDIEELEEKIDSEEDREKKGILLSNLGLLYYLIGKREEAEDNFKKAEKIFKGYNNKIALAALYSNFAMLYEDMRQLDYLYRALDIFEKEGHIKGQVDTLHALAMYYLEDDYVEEAYYFLRKELELVDKIDDNEMKRKVYELAADLAMELGKVEDSLKYTELASKFSL